eukprot:15479852-Alexandrium_andersonii.AAC.1
MPVLLQSLHSSTSAILGSGRSVPGSCPRRHAVMCTPPLLSSSLPPCARCAASSPRRKVGCEMSVQ